MSAASLKRLRLSKFKLETLLDITNAINSNISKHELYVRFGHILKNQLNIGKVAVLSINHGELVCVLQSGVRINSLKKKDYSSFFERFSQITHLNNEENEFTKKFDFILPVIHKNTPLGYILIGDLKEAEGMSPSVKHLNFVQTLANVIMVAIENKRLFNKLISQEGVKKELELAAKMQSLLIPKKENLPNNKKIRIDAYYQPHHEVGGDYYDVIDLGNNEIGFCIADVSGKGISAALLMSNFQAYLRALFTKESNLKDVVTRLNNRIIELTNSDKFITLFIGRINLKTKELKYINCGHIPPILYDRCDKTITYLRKGTIGIGMLSKMPKIKEANYKITCSSRIICVTDGITETENNNLKEFGTSKIEFELKKENSIDMVITETIKKLKKYRGKNPQFDDITILGIDIFK